MKPGDRQAILRISGLEVGPETAGTEPVLQELDLELPELALTTLIGESGCGKTMLCRALTALLPPGMIVRSGRIFFRGRQVDDPSELRGRSIFYAPQNAAASLNPTRRIKGQILESSRRPRRDLPAIMSRLGFNDPERVLQSYPFQLSGGENQRCLLALALCLQPELLILDEPTAALDPELQEETLELISEIQVEFGLSLLLVTHNLELVRRHAGWLAIMEKGRLVETGPAARILAAPQHPYSREIVKLGALLEN